MASIKSEKKHDCYNSSPMVKALNADKRSNKMKKCWVCTIMWPANYVQAAITLNCIFEAITNLKRLGLPLGPLEDTAKSNHIRPELFNSRQQTKKVCGSCVQIINAVQESSAMAQNINHHLLGKGSVKQADIVKTKRGAKKSTSLHIRSIPSMVKNEYSDKSNFFVARVSLLVTELEVAPPAGGFESLARFGNLGHTDPISTDRIMLKYKVLG